MLRSIPLLLAALAIPAAAQTTRERAVAIDRVEIPAMEDFAIEAIGPELNHPWSLAFLSDGAMLVTERHGGLRRIGRDGSASPPLEGGPPEPLQKSDSGLLDVALDPGFAPEVWTLGHRNIQGLTIDSATGAIWSHDHGPRGGDEINRLEAGKNYGWPRTLWGIDYDGKRISDRSHLDGMEDPQFFWSPGIAPSGLAIYHGKEFPQWEGRFLAGALAARGLVELRLGLTTGLLVEERRWLTSLRTRIRDVRIAPDGQVFLLTDDQKGRIWRLVPGKVPADLAADHHLAPVAFLAGNWTGESEFRPIAQAGRRVIAETSTTACRLVHAAHHLRCTSRLTRADGRSRVVEHTFNRSPDDSSIHAAVIGDRWPSYSIDRYKRDPQTGVFESEKPYETDGKKYVERVTLAPAADGKTLLLVESSRPAEGGEWFETFRWTLRKAD